MLRGIQNSKKSGLEEEETKSREHKSAVISVVPLMGIDDLNWSRSHR